MSGRILELPSLSRRELLLGAAAAAAAAPVWRRAIATDSANDARQALQAATRYLWSQQADDGGWHSPQYGLTRSGQSLTPFVLQGLLAVPESIVTRPAEGVERAMEFIVQRVDDGGALGHADPDFAEYPVYATAYALRCALAVELQRPRDMKIVEMARFLAGAQFQAANGFDLKSLAYGGWGFDAPRAPGVPGHMDLAHTRRALEALAEFNQRSPRDASIFERQPMLDRAQAFLAVVQKRPEAAERQAYPRITGDGGFYFSPVVESANKAGKIANEAATWKTYATATCDGVLALLAAGVSRDDDRVAAATHWLKVHDDVDYPQGVLKDPARPWGEAMRFYHYAVRAEAYRALEFSAKERTRLAAALARRQRTDGSFLNTASTLMKEDCPVMCTALAVTAFSNSLDR